MAYSPPAPPPELPELPEGATPEPRWPAWYAPAGFFAAFAAILLALIPVGLIAALAGVDLDGDTPPALTLATVVIQDVILISTAVFIASRTMRPRPSHFGLRRSRFWPAVGWTVLTLVGFYVFAAAYTALASPDGEQTVAEDLGADSGTVALVAGAFVVVVLAPIAEEFFFRGFFYRALRNRLGILTAAAIDGAVFGVIHFTGPGTLELLPILAALGVGFCLLYERTGSLYPCIALHAFNNTIAYSVATDAENGAAAAVPLGATMLVACVAVPRLVASLGGPGRKRLSRQN